MVINKKIFYKVFEILEEGHKLTMLEDMKNYSKFQMLIATMLSSRTKDSTTIPIIKKLFKVYKTPKDFIKLDAKELEKKLFGIGFYKVKAKRIKEISQQIINEFKGKVPNNIEAMTSLPGVGRKTANCMLNYAFKKPAVAVDIHVHRISNRLGWVKTTKEPETEQELMKVLPKDLWIKVNMLLVDHGQNVCRPIGPRCDQCKIRKYCSKNFA